LVFFRFFSFPFANLPLCQATEDVEGISLYLPRPAGAQLSALSFSKMTKLRLLLIICNARFSHSLQYLSNELRILKWDEYPFKTLPLSFHPEELIDLDLSYSQVELWKGEQAWLPLTYVSFVKPKKGGKVHGNWFSVFPSAS